MGTSALATSLTAPSPSEGLTDLLRAASADADADVLKASRLSAMSCSSVLVVEDVVTAKMSSVSGCSSLNGEIARARMQTVRHA